MAHFSSSQWHKQKHYDINLSLCFVVIYFFNFFHFRNRLIRLEPLHYVDLSLKLPNSYLAWKQQFCFVVMIPDSWVSKWRRLAVEMSPRYILGIDVGTTSVKAVLLETGSKTVAASHALPTTSDIIDNSDIKVSTFTWLATLPRCSACPSCVKPGRVTFHAGERAARWSDHKHSEPVRRPAAQRPAAAGQLHRLVRTDARGFILESKKR